MNLKRLLELVDLAISTPPPEAIELYCKPYYSHYYNLLYLISKDLVSSAGAGVDGELPLCVELGVETGRGSFSLLNGGALVMGVDNNPAQKFVLAGHENFIMTIASSMPIPERIRAKGKRSISLLHIDTEHSEAQAREELKEYKPYLKEGAVVLFDDTNACEGEVWRFVESLPYEKFRDDRLHLLCGYAGIIYKEGV